MQRLNELFAAGGIIMLPLIGFSIAVLALAVERFVFWYRVKRRQHKVIQEVLKLYAYDNELAIEKLKRNLDLPAARIFLEALSLKEANPEEFRLALDGAIQAELPLLKRFAPIFETVVGLAPLLGLLGTIMGLIRSFSSLNLGEIGGTKTLGVTAGISEALIATATGLVVAVIALLLANTFRAFYQRQLGLIEEYSVQLELLHRRAHRGVEPSYA
ncbi:MAG: MotA/TolQ/ExbB proton channel family protein [Stenomitos rutilans HA7619-LM2]|jgi:biopolymer transport protein ExbB|nr:MotA/TolQ/ExbB proton channel family protein [Stenomitos rutilans HA7619-LM2]